MLRGINGSLSCIDDMNQERFNFGKFRMINRMGLSIIGTDGFGGGGCMSESDISDISAAILIFKLEMKGRCSHELQPRNSKKPIRQLW